MNGKGKGIKGEKGNWENTIPIPPLPFSPFILFPLALLVARDGIEPSTRLLCLSCALVVIGIHDAY